MSFGKRLALFFILIALVPTLALAGMLILVSEDSREGKADARLAAGLETAIALHEGSVAEALPHARMLARDPDLARAIRGQDQAKLAAFVAEAVGGPITAVEVLGADGSELAGAGTDQAIAFAETSLTSDGEPAGRLRVSVTTSVEFATQVRRLTKRELVVNREGVPLTATVVVPTVLPEPGETADLEVGEGEFRARLVVLNPAPEESLLLLGPRKEGGFLAIGTPAAAILIGFLALGVVFAYALARALTGLHAKVAEQAVTDPLTGLSNRRRWRQLLEREMLRAKRFGHDLSLLIVDVDEFKAINDERGHQYGDAVLERVAGILRRTTRAIDVTARYGGDELALVLLETGPEGAEVLAERLRKNVEKARVKGPDGRAMKVTISVGVATMPNSAGEVAELIEASDQALLLAKREGKNRIRIAPDRPKRGKRTAR